MIHSEHSFLQKTESKQCLGRELFLIFIFSSFRTKLNYNPPKDDGSTYKIELEGISVDIMKEILDYIFSGQVRD